MDDPVYNAMIANGLNSNLDAELDHHHHAHRTAHDFLSPSFANDAIRRLPLDSDMNSIATDDNLHVQGGDTAQ